ncbi:IS110 family transposase [Propionimicrobium sp. PCR01-08-3]|uniref:IS110 family transposase n=1 Tax=Propionimicrobium sp. PCR01-08-3 TaxID=3052086 RepID=UPI00255CB956|nr:IS110 family transposase [Propionimicrobium sp. PCR01-08-3]WIY82024.1 IS110 family transposase [Propionimicrobium sp. PCR01-08-3]WIY83414.1 IS110 family transposase [Propionimicrobium sp. PCR01-08-3]
MIGLDPHKDVLVAVAVDGNGRQLDVKDATARPRGYRVLLAWARKLGPHRWAVEDVRHVAGGLVRFLLAEDEQVVWVPTHMSSDYRRRVRAIGKSDPIDALACARAALAEDLPVAVPETDVREVKVLLDHREDLVGEMVRMCCRLRWHLHDIDPDFAATIPARKLHRPKWNTMVAAFLSERDGGVEVSICLDLIERIKELGDRAGCLERELEERVKVEAPQLLELPGCGPMSAARIVAETGDPSRFKSAAAFAMFTGCAPIPASSGNSQRVRLNRGGNRRMNAAIHRIAITQKRMYPPAQEYLAARRALGNSNIEAIRALKRHLARSVFTVLRRGPAAGRVTSLGPEMAELVVA